MIMPAPFEPKHLLEMDVQPEQTPGLRFVEAKHLEFLAAQGAWSGLVDGRAIVCGGIIINGHGIGQLWSFLSVHASGHMLPITRFGVRLLTLQSARRIEATTRCNFAAGCRWLSLLGFEVEGVMRKFDPDGSDHYLYARVT